MADDAGFDAQPEMVEDDLPDQLKVEAADAQDAVDELDADDEAAVADFLRVAEGRIDTHWSRAEEYRPLWVTAMLGVGCWLCAVYDVLSPKGKFTEWHNRFCKPKFHYQTGRNWRLAWTLTNEGHLPLKNF